MSKIKSFSVGNGDMFYIRHNTDNFTTIDCCLTDDVKDVILDEIESESSDKTIKRFISTHPDDDHIKGIVDYDDKFGIVNFLTLTMRHPSWIFLFFGGRIVTFAPV